MSGTQLGTVLVTICCRRTPLCSRRPLSKLLGLVKAAIRDPLHGHFWLRYIYFEQAWPAVSNTLSSLTI